MKTNEAPEKIYYAPYGDMRENYPITENDIEYTRTDAFIEKAAEWFRTHWRDYVGIDKDNVIRFGLWENDFKNYMKGE